MSLSSNSWVFTSRVLCDFLTSELFTWLLLVPRSHGPRPLDSLLDPLLFSHYRPPYRVDRLVVLVAFLLKGLFNSWIVRSEAVAKGVPAVPAIFGITSPTISRVVSLVLRAPPTPLRAPLTTFFLLLTGFFLAASIFSFVSVGVVVLFGVSGALVVKTSRTRFTRGSVKTAFFAAPAVLFAPLPMARPTVPRRVPFFFFSSSAMGLSP